LSPYQVLARKWRPQRFDDVVGQAAVTRTLGNALASKRLAQAFVFAGPRGVGKTTTARILARALNCVNGPTANPCGVCDACVEIAEGRDIDVLEIDAATHTGVDNVREVIIEGLAILPVRNRYKVFIIDEVHQLSNASFNALLKSIEEPPPHVVFMMATTELDKIPETVLSRSQVYEFRSINTKMIADQLRKIANAEGISVDEDTLLLIARDSEGSMRDAESKLDQVIAFTGTTITGEDVATVLGLVGRDLLLDAVEAVANDDPRAVFALAGRASEMGYDLRAVCRELARVVRDLLVLSVDPARANDPEIAAETERDRLKAIVQRFSREDLLRAFDVLTRAEVDMRAAAQPRHHLEMALLRWMYLRKLVAIEDLLSPSTAAPSPSSRAAQPFGPTPAARVTAGSSGASASPPSIRAAVQAPQSAPPGSLKDGFISEVRSKRESLYKALIAHAHKIEPTAGGLALTFDSRFRTVFDANKTWLEDAAGRIAGRKVAIAFVEAAPARSPEAARDEKKNSDLKAEALADPNVQTLLDVFPGSDIRDVEEM